MDKILVFVETKGDEVRKASLELLSEGRRLAEAGRYTLEAVTLGQMSLVLKEKLIGYADTLVHISDPLLDPYTPEGYALAFAAYARESAPKIILAGATQMGRDFLPRVAVLLGCGIVSDATAVNWNEEPVTFVRPMYGGKVLTEVACTDYPAIVTTRPNAFDVVDPGERMGEFVERQASLSGDQVKTRLLRVEEKPRGKVDLTEADIIVSGGRGSEGCGEFCAYRRTRRGSRRRGGSNEVRGRCKVAGPGGPGG